MRPSNAGLAALALLLAAANTALAAPAAGQRDLDAARAECITAAREAARRGTALVALEHTIELLGRDIDARRRGLDESRAEQDHLLGALLHLARHPPDGPPGVAATPFDKVRGALLLDGAVPALRTEARALAGEIERIAVLRRDIAVQQAEAVPALIARGTAREELSAAMARRNGLTERMLPDDGGAAARIARLARDAADLGDLAKRAEVAAQRREQEVLARARAALPKAVGNALTADLADPTRPRALKAFDPPQTALEMPVAGSVSRRFGDADAEGLSLAAPPGAEAVAPFDGRVVYAGPFRNFGLVLIIRHGGLYHSLLAGLKRLDIAVDRWVLAGEPVGAMPEEGAALYVELRRDGRPVDPQPWLVPSEEGRDDRGGDQRMRE